MKLLVGLIIILVAGTTLYAENAVADAAAFDAAAAAQINAETAARQAAAARARAAAAARKSRLLDLREKNRRQDAETLNDEADRKKRRQDNEVYLPAVPLVPVIPPSPKTR